MVSTDTDAARAQLQLEHWPAESEKMKDRTQCRVKRTLTDLDAAIKAHNKQLEEANQPKAEMDEVIAAQLYTGPVSAPLLLLAHALSCFAIYAYWRHESWLRRCSKSTTR